MTGNQNDPNLADELGRELHRRADDLQESPLGLGDVKLRARSIRRARRLAGAAGIAAVVAALVPVAVLAGAHLDRADGPGPATTSQTPSLSPTRATDPNRSPLPTDANGVPEVALGSDAPDGAAPAAAYVDGRTLHRADGTVVELPESYAGFAIVGDQYLGVRSDDDGNRVLDVLDSTGEITESIAITGGLATSPDGGTVAWSTPDGGITTMWADGRVDLANQGEPVSVVSVVGGPSCREGEGGCSVYFNHEDMAAPEVTSSHGFTDLAVPGAIKVNDVHLQLVALQRSTEDTGSCSGVYDAGARRYAWQTCDYTLSTFSPDGSLLAGSDAYLDGIGLGYVVVLEAATGDPLVRFSMSNGHIADLVWEDEHHLLLTTYGPQGWNVYRVGLDGSVERSVGPNTVADELSRPYTVTGTP